MTGITLVPIYLAEGRGLLQHLTRRLGEAFETEVEVRRPWFDPERATRLAFADEPVEYPDEPTEAVLRYRFAKAGEYLDDYAGKGIDYPVIMRLVELDGRPGPVTLTVAGEVAAARLATMRGDRITDLNVRKADHPRDMNWPKEWSRIKLDLRPHEIATIYLDPVMARKQTRDLDAHRDVWATVHRGR